jgi:hypothetical protein
MPSFACPKCKKVLKSSAPIAPGKKVKCPGCANVFAPQTEDEKTAIQAGKPAAPPRKASPPPDDRPRSRPDLDDDDDAPRQTARKARARMDDDEDEDEEDEDERPARRKGKSKGGNKNLVLILGGVGALVLLLVILLFVWPGFLTSGGGGPVAKVGKNAPAGAALDPLAFVPDNCDMVIGANLGVMRANPAAMLQLEEMLKQNKDLTPAQADLLKSAERGIMAIEGNGPNAKLVLAFNTVQAMDPAKVREAFNAAPAEAGKPYHRIAAGNGRELLALPDARTVVVGTMPEPDFVKVLEAKGKLPPEMQAQVAALDQKTAWGVFNLQGLLKDKQKEINGLAALPNGAAAVPAIKAAKSLSFAMDAGNDARLQIEIACANDQDAAKLETFANNLWETQAKPMLGMAPLMLGNQPGVEGVKLLVNDVSQTFKITRQGAQLSASLAITQQTMKELEKLKIEPPGAPPGVKFKKKK